jgi:Rrf2 family nitric oxide-sensitive transcriptional repressor
MRLTSYTDYALRVLIYAGAAGQSVTISKISESYGISKEHLRKVVHALAQQGYITTTQGRNGGIMLAKPPERINIREIVEQFEPSTLVECFDPATNTCQINGMCDLKHVLLRAQKNFMETLGAYHLSDFIRNPALIAFARQNG